MLLLNYVDSNTWTKKKVVISFVRHEESKIRKAYFRLAQKYHPDKNPEGRVSTSIITDMINLQGSTYGSYIHIFIFFKSFRTCLRKSTKPTSSFAQSLPESWTAPTQKTSSSSSKLRASCSTGTNKVQYADGLNGSECVSLWLEIFNEHPYYCVLTELEPYKYAGYPMLIKTITIETEDEQLFSKTSPLLPAAAELAFHTVNCSALNAEELRRDSGIEVYTQIMEYQPI